MRTARKEHAPEIPPIVRKTVELLDELRGQKCRCRRRKAAGQTFCRDCYIALPNEMRNALYKRFGAGYEEAYQAAIEFLDARKQERKA